MPCPMPQMITAASHGQTATVVGPGYLDASSSDLRHQLPNSQDHVLNFTLLSKVIPEGTLQG